MDKTEKLILNKRKLESKINAIVISFIKENGSYLSNRMTDLCYEEFIVDGHRVFIEIKVWQKI